MDAYRIVLYCHLLALLGAVAAAALVHFAELRRHAAATRREALDWHLLAGKAARTFPLALLALLGTGAYLVHRAWAWDAGWVDAALTGVALLFALGGVIDRRAAGLARALAQSPEGPLGTDLARASRDPVAFGLSWASAGVALAVAFAMTTKPGLGGGLGALACGCAAGVAIAMLLGQSHGRPERAQEPLLAEES